MLENFACGRYRFVLQARTPLRLNTFAGATLRGGFGHVFKRTVCIWPPGDCARCLLKNTCSYAYVFETAPPPGSAKLSGLDQIPRPYVIEPPPGSSRGLYAPGERLAFGLVLVGRAIDYLPYFLFTFIELGRTGLGKEQAQFTLAEVHADGLADSRPLYTTAEGTLCDPGPRLTAADLALAPPPLTPDGRHLVTVHFETPARIRNDGAVRVDLTFVDLVRALLRRLSSLCWFHCGSELQVDFRALIDRAETVPTVRSDLHWHDQDRFSTRQHQRIDMGGLLGRIVFALTPDDWQTYAPLLAAGAWVHVGKGTVMGLGKYRLESG